MFPFHEFGFPVFLPDLAPTPRSARVPPAPAGGREQQPVGVARAWALALERIQARSAPVNLPSQALIIDCLDVSPDQGGSSLRSGLHGHLAGRLAHHALHHHLHHVHALLHLMHALPHVAAHGRPAHRTVGHHAATRHHLHL